MIISNISAPYQQIYVSIIIVSSLFYFSDIQVWFDPLVSIRERHSSGRTVAAMLRSSNIINPSVPFPKLTRPLIPKNFTFFGNDQCFWWQALKRSYSAHTRQHQATLTFRKSSISIVLNFKFEARRWLTLLLCTRFIHPSRLQVEIMSKISFLNFWKALLSLQVKSIIYSTNHEWRYPGDLLFSDPPRWSIRLPPAPPDYT